MRSIRLVTASAALLSSVALLPGCYAEAHPATLTSAEVAYGYEPAYYDGYVVYYDTVGRPYYYVNGAVAWVPPSSPHYAGLVHHWRVYGRSYPRWYSEQGSRYYGYRNAPGYHRYDGYRRR